MPEPKEFQGMQRAELVRLVVRHREERDRLDHEHDRLALWAADAATLLDDLGSLVSLLAQHRIRFGGRTDAIKDGLKIAEKALILAKELP